jgi:hypothetical protein
MYYLLKTFSSIKNSITETTLKLADTIIDTTGTYMEH